MAPQHKFSKMTAAVYKNFFLPRGRIKFVFGRITSSPLIPRGPTIHGVVNDAITDSSSHHFLNFSLSKSFPSSWTSGAGHYSSSVFPIHHQALLSTEALSCTLSTTASHWPLIRNCNYGSVEVTTEFSGSNLGKLSEAGLHLVTGQTLGGVFSQKAELIAPMQVAGLKRSGLQIIREKSRLCDKHTQNDIDGVADVKPRNCKPKVFTSLDSRAPLNKDFSGFREENVDSEVKEWAVGGNIHVQGKESSKSETSGYFELRNSEDPSRNLDNEGLHHRSLRLLSGACCLPHPKKVKSGGEDAFFISAEEQVVGVADGVGGWADVGVDAGDYARELMLQSKLAVSQEPYGYINPARVMIRAHARTKCRGSSTACILSLSDDGLLAANLGDSGFMLIRNGRTIFKSPIQQHQFNIPFQLECGGSDPPSSAEVFSLHVAAGDVLVAGTDGLFDNLYDNELMGIVIHSTRAGLDPQLTSQKIAALARERAEDSNRQTPFSTAAQEAGFRFYGGKMDDITVIVSFVSSMKPGFLNSLQKL